MVDISQMFSKHMNHCPAALFDDGPASLYLTQQPQTAKMNQVAKHFNTTQALTQTIKSQDLKLSNFCPFIG